MEPDHKELLIGLLGSTYGEMKRLDDSIVGSSSTLKRRSDDVKQEITNFVKGAAQKPDVKILQMVQQQPPAQAVPTNLPVQPFVPPQPQVVAAPPVEVYKDDNQLEFDLDKVSRYDDVIAEIDRLDRKLNRIEEKLEQIYKIINTPKKKDPGLNGS